jgi:colanic acid biosynthesis glycosyl transferase WcaI
VVVPPEDPKALADAVEDLYRNPAKVDALGDQGRNYAVENYGFEEALNHYEALFAAVAGSHSEKILEPLPK